MDDLEDITNDRRDGQMTIFAQNAGCWPLDALTNRTMQFGHKVFDGIACFPSTDTPTLQEFLVRCIDPLLIASAGESDPYYTPTSGPAREFLALPLCLSAQAAPEAYPPEDFNARYN